jgi:hypothetical protein
MLGRTRSETDGQNAEQRALLETEPSRIYFPLRYIHSKSESNYTCTGHICSQDMQWVGLYRVCRAASLIETISQQTIGCAGLWGLRAFWIYAQDIRSRSGSSYWSTSESVATFKVLPHTRPQTPHV